MKPVVRIPWPRWLKIVLYILSVLVTNGYVAQLVEHGAYSILYENAPLNALKRQSRGFDPHLNHLLIGLYPINRFLCSLIRKCTG